MKLTVLAATLIVCSMQLFAMEMSEDMKRKLDFDYTVNLPILMRASFENAKSPELNLSKEQITAIREHKVNVMDAIEPVMKEAHEMSAKLKYELIYGKIGKEEAFKMAAKITVLKEQVLDMKITCIQFIRETLTKEQFQKLIEIDKKAMYKNSPYNY
ncbi:MAG: hypothetical protein RL154_961 [Pseudomonadota bacterium]|jgi:hypothetical protein